VAAMRATSTIPIVMTNGNDPIGAGLVASLARPGGNITGLTQDVGDELWGKRLDLLKEVVPKLSRIAILWRPSFEPNATRRKPTEDAARKLGLMVRFIEFQQADDFKNAFASMAKERVGGCWCSEIPWPLSVEPRSRTLPSRIVCLPSTTLGNMWR